MTNFLRMIGYMAFWIILIFVLAFMDKYLLHKKLDDANYTLASMIVILNAILDTRPRND